MNREEHLEWCKKRALEYLKRNEVRVAALSFLSDLSKHPDTKLIVLPVGNIRDLTIMSVQDLRTIIEGVK